MNCLIIFVGGISGGVLVMAFGSNCSWNSVLVLVNGCKKCRGFFLAARGSYVVATRVRMW